MGDIRADLEADLKIAEADVAEAKVAMDKASAEHARLRTIRAGIKVQLLKLDLYIGSKWQLHVTVDRYYGSKRLEKVKVIFVDETHLIYLRSNNQPERVSIEHFIKNAKKVPDNA